MLRGLAHAPLSLALMAGLGTAQVDPSGSSLITKIESATGIYEREARLSRTLPSACLAVGPPFGIG